MSSSRLILPEDFQFDTLEQVREEMIATMSGTESVELDASGVASMDYGSVQLLLAFKQALDVDETGLEWLPLSDFLRAKLTRLGLTQILGIE